MSASSRHSGAAQQSPESRTALRAYPGSGGGYGFRALLRARWHGDIHRVTKWSKFDTGWEGVSFDDLLAAVGSTPRRSPGRWRGSPTRVCGATGFVCRAATVPVEAGVAPGLIRTERFGG